MEEAEMADSAETLDKGLDFDPDTLREKYRRERDKRLRADGEAQYMEVTGKHAAYVNTDPYAPKVPERARLTDDIEVIIVGGGWAGQLSAARLTEAGVTNFRIIEDGSDFGGTWYWNRYPGAQCDIESYCYLPLLEETGYMPKEKYSFAPEIQEHAQRIGKFYNLYEKTVFQTRVTEMHWDEKARRWLLKTNRDDEMKAHFVMMATGPAARPKLPGIPGFDTFEGHTFHTSRWDYDYTGGDHSGNLTKLADKKVAIIGTGATGVQAVSHLGQWAKHLYVFQRTPSSVDLRRNKPTDPEWAKSLTPGWQSERRKNFNDVVTGRPFEVDLVADGWTDIFRKLAGVFAIGVVEKKENEKSPEELALLAEIADFQKMNEIRARCDEAIENPEVAEQLKPYYRQFCKRPTFNDDYLPTFNRPNVTLVDTAEGGGVERITKKGIVAGGVEYEVDCIIYATGFEMSTSHHRRIGMDIHGKRGLDLFDYWKDGMRTLHGHSVHNFPNWFFVGLTQVGASFNFCAIVDEVAKHVSYIIAETEKRGDNAVVEATAEAEGAWVEEIHSFRGANDAFLESCTPGYYNNEGGFKETPATFQGDFYVPGSNVFNQLLADWRSAGKLEGMEINP
jgi:cyclohexanone monooxygenase